MLTVQCDFKLNLYVLSGTSPLLEDLISLLACVWLVPARVQEMLNSSDSSV